MGKTIIEVKNLSKVYRLGIKESQTESVGQAILQWVLSPLRNFRRLRRLSKFDLNKEEQDVLWALRDINFKVEQGEVLGIIGKNGAGKSTLLKILSQVTPPSDGEIRMRGRVASLLEVGTGFNPELTGRENVYLNGTILGMTRVEVDAKFDEIIAFSGVEKFIDTPVKRYSSGMKVRLAFAVAAHLEPEILIIDEVLAVGDAEFQRKCLGKMQDVAGEGRTVLFVSHNMPAVSSLCTRAIMLRHGELFMEGNVDDVINGYLNEQSARAEVGLAELTDRWGSGLVKFTDVQFSTDPDQPIGNVLYAGQQGIFTFTMESHDTQVIPQASLAILIQDVQHQRVTTLHTRFTGNLLSFEPGVNTVTCTIPKINLMPGKYWVTLHCIVGGESSQVSEPADHVDQAAYFFVEGGDFFGSGKIPNDKHGMILVEQAWAQPQRIGS
ncbi:MAG TPA: polysaccharide/polyol phosphate ABC transporter ATP-binding protein [Cytophagales bacterium]|nr:polysaccharide/polyol phosphate ABC transporter ATP-binding protein [Cytophagales bacterium]